MSLERLPEGADMVRYALKVPKEEVFYMSWTIDAYEGVAFLRNEAEPGVVSVICSQDYASEAESIIEAFELEGIPIERLGGAGATSDAGV